MKLINYVYLLLLVLISCKTEQSSMTETKKTFLPEWAKKDVIYEVNIRQYTPEGTINAFSDHLPRLKAMGVDILWIMPVFPISETKKKGELGSYYAVSDFRAINPAFGTKEDMLNLIKKVHAYDMKIILDWVPNHTGWDHTWITTNPEFYKKDSLGNIIDPIDDKGNSMGWADVAALDYNMPEMRTAMISDLIYWVKEHNIDGYRMDIAFGPPHDFWKQFSDTIRQVKPDIFLLAEAEDPAHMNEGWFNTGYGWSFHHLMNAIAKREKNVYDIAKWRQEQGSQFVLGTLMNFTSNHDENSWNGTEYERMGLGTKSFAILSHTFDGIPLIYSGQEEPLERRLEFFKKDDIGFKNYANAEFYAKLNKLKHDNEALWNDIYGGELVQIGESAEIYAFKREKNGNKVVVLVNLSSQNRKITINQDIGPVRDIFSTKLMNIKKGDEIAVDGYEYIVAVGE